MLSPKYHRDLTDSDAAAKAFAARACADGEATVLRREGEYGQNDGDFGESDEGKKEGGFHRRPHLALVGVGDGDGPRAGVCEPCGRRAFGWRVGCFG